jgi:hypothetical protein
MSEHLKNVQFPVAFAAVWLEEITAATYDGSPRLDRDTNSPIWVLGVSAKLEGQARRISLNVQVVSEQPPSVPVDAAVVLVQPTLSYWVSKSGRSGLTVRARDVVLAPEPQPPVAASVAAEPVPGRAGLPTGKPQAGEGK